MSFINRLIEKQRELDQKVKASLLVGSYNFEAAEHRDLCEQTIKEISRRDLTIQLLRSCQPCPKTNIPSS